jgi:hypothetical protein
MYLIKNMSKMENRAANYALTSRLILRNENSRFRADRAW